MARPTHPSNLELQALSVLWNQGPSTVATVHESLPDGRARAYTTVLSVMQSLERKNLVKRENARQGRALVYVAAYSRELIVQRTTHDFLTNAFGGRAGDAILAIISTGTLTPAEKTRIELELKRYKAMAAKKTAKKTAAKTASKSTKPVAQKAPAKKAAAKKAVKAVKKAAKSAKKAPAKKAAKTVAKKAPAKKAAAKKAPAKKAPAKKAPAKKAAAKKAPAKKAPAKKAPAKKAAKAPVAKKAPAKKVAKKAAKKSARKP